MKRLWHEIAPLLFVAVLLATPVAMLAMSPGVPS